MLSVREDYLRDNITYVVDVAKTVSRSELALAMGTSPQAVGQLISGTSKGLRPLNLIRAARRIGVSVEDLVTIDLRHTGGRSGQTRDKKASASIYVSEAAAPAYSTLPAGARRLIDVVNKAATILPDQFFDHTAHAIEIVIAKFAAADRS